MPVHKDNNNICYTGIGSLNRSNHTKKQFLHIMDSNFNKDCSEYIKSLKCNSCKKSLEMNTREVKKQIKIQKNKSIRNKSYKMTKKTEKKLVKQILLCRKCKNKNTKKCSFNNYIKFSGANIGNCKV